MEIKNNVTLGGLMKRFQRKYPKTSQGIRKSFIMSSLFFIMMTLIPGCSLPLQTSIKITVLDVYISLHLQNLFLHKNVGVQCFYVFPRRLPN